ncbi:protein VPRBP-like, partial [Tropilaelaps mercedesae]
MPDAAAGGGGPDQATAGGNGGSINELNQILDEWGQSRGAGQDPIPVLSRLCEIVERENELYLKMDIDPFDDRHPSRTNPNSALGSLLKTLFRNDDFMDTLVNTYISARDNKKLNE